MHYWPSFYETLGGAAAALLGLLFVSVSVNTGTILSDAHLASRRLAEQAFQNYLAVLLVSLALLIPGVGTMGFGITLLSITGIWAVWVLIRMYRSLAGSENIKTRITAFRRFAASVVGFALLIYSGIRLARGGADDQLLVPIALMILLASATILSWELLIRVASDGARH